MADVGKKKLGLDEFTNGKSTGRLTADKILKALDDDMNSPVDSWNIKKMMDSLNEALALALNAEKYAQLKSQVASISAMALKMLNAEPERFIEEFGKPIEAGSFAGKNSAYVWMDQLYSAVLVAQDEAPVMDIFILLLAVFKKYPQQFCHFLMDPVVEDKAETSNGLFLFTRILANVSHFSYQYPSRLLITKFFSECVTSFPEVLGKGLCREMTGGSYKGKSPLYMAMDALKKAAVDDPVVVGLICSVIIELNQKHPTTLINTLASNNGSGPYAGKNSLQTILTALISSSYVRDKPEIAANLINTLRSLWGKNPECMGLLLTKPIESGDAIGQNGILMLVRAFTTMLDNQMEPGLLITLLDTIISANPEGMTQALTQKAHDTRREYDHVSALQQLLGFVPHQPQVRALVETLASSSSAPQIMCSLFEPHRDLFIQVFVEKHSLSPKESDLLARLLPNGPINGSAGEPDIKVGDFLSRIRAGAYHSPFFAVKSDDASPSQPQNLHRQITNK